MKNWEIALLGWLAWNALILNIDKDSFDAKGETFPILKYIQAHWDNWFASLVMIPLLLWFGSRQLGLDATGIVEFEKLKWSDSYYPMSGVITEFALYWIKKIKKKLSEV